MGVIPPTINGYSYLEVVSAFQKAIRRNDEKTALFFGVEIALSNKEEALWRRLKVITSEDVGLACLSAPAVIESLHSAFKEAKKQKKPSHPERLMIVHAILFLCRCNKSRLIDWATCSAYPLHGMDLMPIPDYAFDMHTAKGKKMGRDLQHFANHGSFLNNHKLLDKENEYKQKALKVLQDAKDIKQKKS